MREALERLELAEREFLAVSGWRRTEIRQLHTGEPVWVDPLGGKMLETSKALLVQRERLRGSLPDVEAYRR